jgi:hypothetical protein
MRIVPNGLSVDWDKLTVRELNDLGYVVTVDGDKHTVVIK